MDVQGGSVEVILILLQAINVEGDKATETISGVNRKLSDYMLSDGRNMRNSTF